MGKIEVDKVAINMSILKICRFYHILDPNSVKFLNRNIYKFLCIMFITFTLCVIFFGHVGMFTNMDDTLSDINLLQLMFSYIYFYLNMVKISVFLYKAKTVWNLFDVVRSDFLRSKQCRKSINTLYDCRDLIIKSTKYYIFIILMFHTQWMSVPLLMNAFNESVNCRKQNIINIPFPVSIHTYNQYYVSFYVIELMVVSLCTYTLIVIDILIISFCWVIIILYQILTKSFADVGYANKPQSGKKIIRSVND